MLAGIVATLMGGYMFGVNHMVDFHPIVRAAMDDGYLLRDFYVTAGRSFGPRLWYAQLFAFIATPESLPIVYFSATLLINVAMAVVTGLFARDVFRSPLAGFFAVAAVMSTRTLNLGGGPEHFSSQVNPTFLGLPMALAGVWAGYRGRPVLAALAAGVAALVHPTLGLETGALVLVAMAVTRLVEAGSIRESRRLLVPVGTGLGILAAFALLTAVPYASSDVPFELVRETMIMRLGDQVIPSAISLGDWVTSVLFLTGAVLAWRWLRRRDLPSGSGSTFLTALVAAIAAFLVGGFLFVEVFPSRLWTFATPFHRMSPLLGRLGLLALTGAAAVRVSERDTGTGLFLQATTVSPVAVGLGHMAAWARDRGRLPWMWHTRSRELMVASAILIAGIVVVTPARNLALFLLIHATAAWLLLVPKTRTALVIPALATGLLGLFLIGGQSLGGLPSVLDKIGPEILASHMEGPEVDIARQAKLVTTEDALILTPPDLGTLRIAADRAILVDFKAFPFQEEAILEWRDRLVAAYGITTHYGSRASRELDANYRAIGSDRLVDLCRDYGITHAVLYQETPTALPIVAQNDTYKLVELLGCG